MSSQRRRGANDWMDEVEAEESALEASTPVEQLRHLAVHATSETARVQALRILIEKGIDLDGERPTNPYEGWSDEMLDEELAALIDTGFMPAAVDAFAAADEAVPKIDEFWRAVKQQAAVVAKVADRAVIDATIDEMEQVANEGGSRRKLRRRMRRAAKHAAQDAAWGTPPTAGGTQGSDPDQAPHPDPDAPQPPPTLEERYRALEDADPMAGWFPDEVGPKKPRPPMASPNRDQADEPPSRM